jgi:hypothetical protein
MTPHLEPMTRSADRARVAAGVAWVFIVALTAISVVFILWTWNLPVPASWGFRGGILLFAVVFGTVGAVICRRRPRHRIGWLFLVCGLLSATQGFATSYVEAGVFAVNGDLPLIPAFGWLLTWIWVPAIGLATIGLPLLFPDGRLVSPAWRPVGIFAVASLGVQSVAFAVAPGPISQAVFLDNPLGLSGVDQSASVFYLAFIGWPVAVVLAVASLVIRWRRAEREARQQLKWLALAGLLTLAAVVAYTVALLTAGLNGGDVKVTEVGVTLAILSIPIATGLAILRYRLYEIDRIISRTIGWAVVTGILVAVFVGLVVALQTVLAPITNENTLAVAASTLVAFALFQPLRRRVQRAVDRRFDRARYDGERVVASFAGRLRDQVDLGSLELEVARVAFDTVRPTRATVWLRIARDRPRASVP